jgi:cation diffusion facilitator CzcD-associated flavoprotein CzcO
MVPDADLFKAIRDGRASLITDRIETFTENGIRLESGAELEADLIVTATGLNLLLVGGMRIAVDGTQVDLATSMAYKGMMLSGLPNFTVVLGYSNASWTLKCDIVCDYICRLLNFMDEHGYSRCTPRHDPSMGEEPIIDLSSGYIQRAIAKFPKQGLRAPWRLRQNYALDLFGLRFARFDDGVMQFA